ncbi:hypothetical protein P3S68_027388 [Capsicum galapagoense]
MSMVYGLLKRMINYAGKEGRKKMDEVWITYCGMSVCFGLKEFAIVMGLRCDRPEEPLIKETPHKGSNKYKVWACESIPPLRKQFKDYPDEVSHTRILRWLAAAKAGKKNIKEQDTDLFNHPDDAWFVVHPWIMPTDDELGMTFFLTLGLVDTKEDPTMKLIKNKLAGETFIRRAVRQGLPNVKTLHDQPQTATDPGASSEGIAGGVICDGSSYPVAVAIRDYEHAQQKINTFENAPCTGPSHPTPVPPTPTVVPLTPHFTCSGNNF